MKEVTNNYFPWLVLMKITCLHCGYTSFDSNIPRCPKCGNSSFTSKELTYHQSVNINRNNSKVNFARLCPKCGEILEEDWQGCPKCGEPLKNEKNIKLRCPKCGIKVEEKWVRCPECLEELKKKCKKCGVKLENKWKACPECGQIV